MSGQFFSSFWVKKRRRGKGGEEVSFFNVTILSLLVSGEGEREREELVVVVTAAAKHTQKFTEYTEFRLSNEHFV